MSILAHDSDIIIDHGVGAPEHGRDIVDGINNNETRFISILMENLQLNCYKGYDNNMATCTTTHKEDVSIVKELKKTIPIKHKRMVIFINASIKTCY